MPVKTEPMAAFCAVTLMKASSCNCCRPTRAASRETIGSGLPDRTMAVLRCRFSIGSIVYGAALEDRGRRWSSFVLHGASVELSSHAWPTGATPSHAWLAGAPHDGSSRVFASGWTTVGRWRRWAPWWRRRMSGLARMMRISLLKMGQWSDDDDGF